jgi:hypothetical protein
VLQGLCLELVLDLVPLRVGNSSLCAGEGETTPPPQGAYEGYSSSSPLLRVVHR